MADHVDTLFPTYLPTRRLVTHNKHDNQRFKHQTFIYNNKTHDFNKETQKFYYINGEEITKLLTCKELNSYTKNTRK